MQSSVSEIPYLHEKDFPHCENTDLSWSLSPMGSQLPVQGHKDHPNRLESQLLPGNTYPLVILTRVPFPELQRYPQKDMTQDQIDDAESALELLFCVEAITYLNL